MVVSSVDEGMVVMLIVVRRHGQWSSLYNIDFLVMSDDDVMIYPS